MLYKSRYDYVEKLGAVITKKDLLDLLAPYKEDTPIRFETMAPVEVYYISEFGDGTIILE